MKTIGTGYFLSLSLLLAIIISIAIATAQASEHPRESDFNFDWKFTLVNNVKLPKKIPLEDEQWRNIRLPHDWSVEASFDETLEGATGYLPGGVGIYQKHFKTPANSHKNTTYVVFDGVYNNATFWLNGQYLGENPYGYSPVNFDLSPFLKKDNTDNVLTVHVDHSRYGDSRWYTGSGIYRNVTLVTTSKLHVPVWGTYVTTPKISTDEATISIEISVKNNFDSKQAYVLHTAIENSQGKVVSETSTTMTLNAQSDDTAKQSLSVMKPALWDVEHPNMYKAISRIEVEGKAVDTYVTPFGIRSLAFVAQKGFFLNGKSTLLKGVSLHHDGGLVGAAVPKAVWKRRLLSLKEAGLNAIRTAHNPFSEEFIALCDELGIMVQTEFFDEFDYNKDKRLNMHERHDDYITRGYVDKFQEWAKDDLTRTMLRDRNHPSIIQWSIGNEIEWTYVHYRYVTGFWTDPADPTKMEDSFWGGAPKFSPEELKARYNASEKGEYILADTAKTISSWVKALDTTRPTTANFILPQVSHISGYTDAVDIIGYSYRNSVIPWAQTHFPNKIITINENPGTWDDWKQVLEFPGVFSQFMWTGIDYIGERHEKWPDKSGWGDMLDLAGFKRQGWNYFKSVWVNEPHLSLGTLPLKDSGFGVDELSGLATANDNSSYRWRDSNMYWHYKEGENILVEVTSNHSIVGLFLNGESLGYRSMSEAPDRIFRWIVPYTAGNLEARAGFKGQEQTATLVTTTTPSSISVTSDKKVLSADGYDVAHLVVQLVDEQGRAVKHENTELTFELLGSAKWLGVDNGAPDFNKNFQTKSINTDRGRALAIVQSTRDVGDINVIVTSKGLPSQTITLRAQ